MFVYQHPQSNATIVRVPGLRCFSIRGHVLRSATVLQKPKHLDGRVRAVACRRVRVGASALGLPAQILRRLV